MNKIPKILMLSLPILILVLVIFLFARIQKQLPTTTTGGEVPTPTPTPEVFVPSKWAGDEEVLGIESNILNLEKDLESVDLKELQLLPPSLDMEVKF